MSLNISNSLTYTQPESVLDGKINYVSFKPQGANVYQASETISILWFLTEVISNSL